MMQGLPCSQSWPAKNPRIGLPCCLASCQWLWFLIYATYLVIDDLRQEVWVDARCALLSYSLQSSSCTLSVCSPPPGSPAGASPTSGPCTSLATTCFSCRYVASALSVEGHALMGFTDWAANWASSELATKSCIASLGSSPVPCAYQVASKDTRFVLSVVKPEATASPLPVILFAAGTMLCAIFTCTTAFAVAGTSGDVSAARLYALAERRTRENEAQAARWRQAVGIDEDDVGWIEGARSPTARVTNPLRAQRP
jgi:hypothetical protein